jgi:hypothetical protein
VPSLNEKKMMERERKKGGISDEDGSEGRKEE